MKKKITFPLHTMVLKLDGNSETVARMEHSMIWFSKNLEFNRDIQSIASRVAISDPEVLVGSGSVFGKGRVYIRIWKKLDPNLHLKKSLELDMDSVSRIMIDQVIK